MAPDTYTIKRDVTEPLIALDAGGLLGAVRQRRSHCQPEVDEQGKGLAEHGEIFVQRADLPADLVQAARHDRASISVVARRNGVAPNLLYRWRRLMLEGGSVAVSEDYEVTSNTVVRQMEDRIRELERQIDRKTLEAEILREALDKSRPKNRPCLRTRR